MSQEPWIAISTSTPSDVKSVSSVQLQFLKRAAPLFAVIVFLLTPVLVRSFGVTFVIACLVFGLLLGIVVLKAAPARMKRLRGDELWRQVATQNLDSGILVLRPSELTWRPSWGSQANVWSTELRSITSINIGARRRGKLGFPDSAYISIETVNTHSPTFWVSDPDGFIVALVRLGAITDVS